MKLPTNKIKVLFLTTEDWYFFSHRLALARACHQKGWEVCVATNITNKKKLIEEEGFKPIPIKMRRRFHNPLKEFVSFIELILLFAQERPNIIHHVGLKPVIYGSLAAYFRPPNFVINALAGLGYVFTSGKISVLIIRRIVQFLLKLSFFSKRHWLIVQNYEDAAHLVGARIVKSDRVSIIRGSGVNITQFVPNPEPAGVIKAVVVSRMIKDKGIVEVVNAARELKRRGSEVKITLIGVPDDDNPSSIDMKSLHEWSNQGIVEWQGWSDDIPNVWSNAHIAVLPSYREGLPKALLEACACGRPIVTTDIPGTQDLVIDSINGITVPVGNSEKIADAIEKLALNPSLRTEYGKMSRKIVEMHFQDKIIIEETMKVYEKASRFSNKPFKTN